MTALVVGLSALFVVTREREPMIFRVELGTELTFPADGRILFEIITVSAQGGVIDPDLYLARTRALLDDIEKAEGPFNRLSKTCQAAA